MGGWERVKGKASSESPPVVLRYPGWEENTRRCPVWQGFTRWKKQMYRSKTMSHCTMGQVCRQVVVLSACGVQSGSTEMK